MTPDQLHLIRASFAKVVPIKEVAGRMFYDRLFAIAPEIRPMFRGNIDEQARKLVDTLAVAVSALRDMPALAATLQDLGNRHRGYGVGAQHYAKVGEALLWTLEQGLGPDFDAPTRMAWIKLYTLVAQTMEPKLATAAA